MDICDLLLEKIDNLQELEQIYRKDPEAFKKALSCAREQRPDSKVLAVWHERLHYVEPVSAQKAPLLQKDFLVMAILAILAGICTRVLLHFVEQQAIAPINLVFGVFPFIAAYFAYSNAPKRNLLYILGLFFLGFAVYLNLLPLEQKDSIILAYLHLPVFLWVLLGLAYTGNDYRTGSARLAYLKFNGEFCILYAIMAIAGMLLTGLTLQLFGFAGMDISELYFKNVVLFGAAALAVLGSYLVLKNLKLSKNIAPYLAKIFSPLVLVTLVVYLTAVGWAGKNPFLDRDFLLSFNGILLSVLAVTIFSITESGADEKKGFFDYVNFALIALALIIDTIALSAIVFRLSSYGITPNRLAVLGVNLLIWANLIWIMLSYLRFLRDRVRLVAVQDAVTKYLPIYGLWAAVVTIAFPLIF